MNIDAIIHKDCQIITRNTLLARDLVARFDLQQREKGETVWKKPPVDSLYHWVVNAWTNCWPEEQLIHPAQELMLYQNVVSSSQLGLISTMATARQARKAAALCRTHDLDIDAEEFGYLPETELFQQWEKDVRNRLKTMHWHTFESMLDDFIARVEHGNWTPTVSRFMFLGFLSFTPQQNRLITALRAAGIQVDILEPATHDAPSHCAQFSSPEMQIRTVAGWLSHELEQSQTHSPRLALVVPDLKAFRENMEPLLEEILCPTRQLPSAESCPVPWEYAVGTPLLEHPLISSACHLLGLQLYNNEFTAITRLLLNPYVGIPDIDAAARVDYFLRSHSGRTLGLARLVSVIRDRAPTLKGFAGRLEKLKAHIETDNTRTLPSTWANRFDYRLSLLGWAGQDDLDSETYQVLNAWEKALASFSSLDRQTGEINLGLALNWLREILFSQMFQLHKQYRAPITILEYPDAPGLYFDKAFVLDLSQDILPRPVAPNPFLPASLQEAASIPLSTAESTLVEGTALIACLSQIAREVTFCCPCTDHTGNPVTPSSLVAGWQKNIDDAPSISVREQILAKGKQTVIPDTDPIPPVTDPEAEGIRGGTSIIKMTAENPLGAFLRARLGIKPFPCPEPGLNKMAQGNLIHAAMECFWNKIRTRDALCALEGTKLTGEIKAAVRSAVLQGDFLPPWRYGQTLADMEMERVATLVQEWLEIEARRTEPFEVIHLEKKAHAVVAGLPLELRIDRIDKVETITGHAFLEIDYKTGNSVNPGGWRTDALTEPQLPIYAAWADFTKDGIPHIDGIAFAHISAGQHRFHELTNWTGYLAPFEGMNGKQPEDEWNMQLSEWKEAIAELAARFMDGDVRTTQESMNHWLYADLASFVRSDV